MGRSVTVNIKNRVKVTIYPSREICDQYMLQHIYLQDQLKRYIDKTLHCDAVLTVGMRHADEVVEEIEKLTNSTKK